MYYLLLVGTDMTNVATVAKTLTKKYPLPVRNFGCKSKQHKTNEWIRRRLFANIIVGGSKDEYAVDGAEWLFRTYKFSYLADRANYKELRRAIADKLEQSYGIRFAGKKADYILNTAYALKEKYRGVVPKSEAELTAFPGVGKHAAAVVRGLAFGERTFGVDLHVRRIAKRLGLVPECATDNAIAKHLGTVENSTHFSRALVDFGKDICGYTANCGACPFKANGCNPRILK
jgi:endonuclease-3